MTSKNNPAIFIDKLWNILETGYQSIISWQEDGLSFVIFDENAFIHQILSVNFNQSNYSSFIRQLNMYNFRKNRRNKNHQQFYHELFRKNHKVLLKAIKRKPTQSDIVRGRELLKIHGLHSEYFQQNEGNHSIEHHYQNQNENHLQNYKQNQNKDLDQTLNLSFNPVKLIQNHLIIGNSPRESQIDKNQRFLRDKFINNFFDSQKENFNQLKKSQAASKNSDTMVSSPITYLYNSYPSNCSFIPMESYFNNSILVPISYFNYPSQLGYLNTNSRLFSPVLVPISQQY